MTKKQWFLVAFAFALAVVYLCCFTDWFRHKEIRISSTSRASLSRFHSEGMSTAIAFRLDREYELTEVKVVPLLAWQSNPTVVPVWHLVGDRESAPIELFLYGDNIDGMEPAIPGAKPGTLENNVTYRLFVFAGSVKGQHDFWIGGKPPEGTNSAGH